MARTKTIYRDKTTQRLIPEREAQRRDPETYTLETFERPDPREFGIGEDEPTMQDGLQEHVIVAA